MRYLNLAFFFKRRYHSYLLFVLFLFLFSPIQANASVIRVAVASNFLLPLKQIASVYRRETGNKVVISAGSTGKLYAQIINGAPYDIFLAANNREPERLEKENMVMSGSRFTYAQGKLALWDPKGHYLQGDYQESLMNLVLNNAEFKRLSIANPATAPYGDAAMSVIEKLKLTEQVNKRIIRGENISQAYQYVASGAADLGFVAYSQIKMRSRDLTGRYWVVDLKSHKPIVQQAVLLKNSRNKIKSQQFLDYLKSDKGLNMIREFGYATP